MKIKAAAIIHEDVIYEGRTHAEIGWKMLDDGVCERPFPSGVFTGFVTEGGNYVDRKLALRIAIDAGQVEEGKTDIPDTLYSEDLIHSEVWDYPLKDQSYQIKNP
jgi:hypothetical protein